MMTHHVKTERFDEAQGCMVDTTYCGKDIPRGNTSADADGRTYDVCPDCVKAKGE